MLWRKAMLLFLLIFSSAGFCGPTEDIRDVIVVGSGAAGLVSADYLRKAGLSFVVLEKDLRSGGRIFSRPDIDTQLGLILDEGANLINSTDKVALHLLEKFHIPYVRRLQSKDDGMNFYLNGKLYTQAQMERKMFQQNRAPLQAMAQDQEKLFKKKHAQIEQRFKKQSIEAYLRERHVDQDFYRLAESFFWSEYGQDLKDLNVNVFFDYFDIDSKKESMHLIPNADEAFTVPGGVGQIAVRLEQRNHEFIRYGRQVTHIQTIGKNKIEVRAHTGGGDETYLARHVIFAAPLHSLRRIWISVPGLSPHALNEARAANYARGTKLHMKFKPGFHEVYKFSGILTTDTGEQIWISSFGQSGAGLVTVLTGPVDLNPEALEHKKQQVLTIMEKMAPGVSRLFAGVERSDAPMSYSGAIRPGEESELEFDEGTPQLIPVGEAIAGSHLRGYLEGALRSAEKRTKKLIRRCEDELRGPSKIGLKPAG